MAAHRTAKSCPTSPQTPLFRSTAVAWRVAGTLVSSLVALSLSGCASGPVQYQINATAHPVINRNVTGEPLSVVIRLYQLKGRNAFDQLTFDTAANGRDERELFGDELVARTELVAVPGATRTLTDDLSPETRYVGITGLFRQADGQNWRYLVDAKAVRRKGLRLLVEDCHLKMLEPAPLPIPGQAAGHYPECQPLPLRSEQRAQAR